MTAIGPFYVGQVPADTLVVTVTTDGTNAKDLAAYTGCSLLVTDGLGNPVNFNGACVLNAPKSSGKVLYTWPATTHFVTAGQYKLQVHLTAAGGISDYTTVQTFQVQHIND